MAFWNEQKAYEFYSATASKYGASATDIAKYAGSVRSAIAAKSDPTDADVRDAVNDALLLVFSPADYAAAKISTDEVTKYRTSKAQEEKKPSSSQLPEEPSSAWEGMSERERKQAEKALEEAGILDFVENIRLLEKLLLGADELSDLGPATLATFQSLKSNKILYHYTSNYYPRIDYILGLYEDLVKKTADIKEEEITEGPLKVPGKTFEEEMKDTFGEAFAFNGEFLTTQDQVNKWIDEHINSLPNILPDAVAPHEIRIGLARFAVPPLSISVNQSFQTGTFGMGAIRQRNSPKFNTGHSDTMIEMTLFFPNEDEIWGFEGEAAQINFDDPETDYKIIDQFASSLRGLIAQFKYAPILPIKGEYINRTYNVTAVALKNMSINTVEDFPFTVAVNLQMQAFNHKVFLPMINDFNNAIHWGKFRHYLGRAAQSLQREGGQAFAQAGENEQFYEAQEGKSIVKFEKDRDLGYFTDRYDRQHGKHFVFYYPKETPGRIFAPDTSNWRQYGEDSVVEDQSIFDAFLEQIGYGSVREPEEFVEYLKDWDQNWSNSKLYAPGERRLVIEYLTNLSDLESATKDKRDEYIAERIEALRREYAKNGQEFDAGLEEFTTASLKTWWYWALWGQLTLSPAMSNYLEAERLREAQYRVAEWKVPMERMDFDWNNVIVQGVSCSLSNNFARLQLQMQDGPTFQYIGGGDSQISLSLVVFGEDDLIRIRRLFEHLNSLARLEHAHAILGFLGVKNVITALSGIKYVLPLDLNVDTIDGYPHVYAVNMTFTDFDLEQQRREDISEEQQNEIVAEFGKRNPFLRVKQLWGAFSAYPDLPLSIKNKSGKVIGHLDPDYYYRSFTTFDEDMIDWNLSERESVKASEEAARKNEEKHGSSTSWAEKFRNAFNTEEEKDPDDPEKPDESKEPEPTEIESPFNAKITEPNVEPKSKNKATVPYKNINHLMLVDGQVAVDGLQVNRGDVTPGSYSLTEGKFNSAASSSPIYDDVAEAGLTTPIDDESDTSTMLTPYGDYGHAYINSSNGNPADPANQFEAMMKDTQYRDVSGRMVRAYPTYMLWLIDEGGRYAGVKLFDNFYGLQSVMDMSIHRSEDIMADTLVLRLSNLYKKLTTPYSTNLFGAEDDVIDGKDFIDMGRIRADNLLSGTQNIIRHMDTIRLKPGVRVHLRLGYSGNPNSLETVFNGTIAEVKYGDIVEVVAQSDAVELGGYINSTSKSGHSGKIDGGLLTSLYLSEPRDLMVRLLSMGASTFRENIAHALNGMVFSENRWGIRHFGHILYEPMGSEEAEKHNKRYNQVMSATDIFTQGLDSFANSGAGDVGDDFGDLFSVVTPGGFDALLGGTSARKGQFSVVNAMLGNFMRRRDYELYKRNIYPGNGTGVAQFLGGDFPEAGLVIAEAYSNDTQALLDEANTDINPQFRNRSRAENLSGNTRIDSGDDDSQQQQNIDPNAVSPTEAEALVESTQKKLSEQANGNAGGESSNAGSNYVDTNTGDILTSAGNVASDFATGDLDLDTIGDLTTVIGSGWELFQGIANGQATHPVLQALGLTGNDDDLAGFDEVSFRASTYMKTVWDMFQTCASLLPNYIVAVRPFEDRSTVFYGKPHWLYTSGVVPISQGLEKDPAGNDFNIEPDKEMTDLIRRAQEEANPLSDLEQQMAFRKELDTVPVAPGAPGAAGAEGSAGAADSTGVPGSITLEQVHAMPDEVDGVKAPVKSGLIAVGPHLPVLPDYQDDQKYHDEGSGLGALSHPQFMITKRSEADSALKKANQTLLFGGKPDPLGVYQFGGESLPPGAFGYFSQGGGWANWLRKNPIASGVTSVDSPYAGKKLTPAHEKYYIAMKWRYKSWTAPPSAADSNAKQSQHAGFRMVVYNQRTNKAVVCAIADEHPGYQKPSNHWSHQYSAFISPEAFVAIGAKVGDKCSFGLLTAQNTPLGPMATSAGAGGGDGSGALTTLKNIVGGITSGSNPSSSGNSNPNVNTAINNIFNAVTGGSTSPTGVGSGGVDPNQPATGAAPGAVPGTTPANTSDSIIDSVSAPGHSLHRGLYGTFAGQIEETIATAVRIRHEVDGATDVSESRIASIVSSAYKNIIAGHTYNSPDHHFDYTINGQFWEPSNEFLRHPWLIDPVGHLARRLLDRNYNKYWEENKGDKDLIGSSGFESEFTDEGLDHLDEIATPVKGRNWGEGDVEKGNRWADTDRDDFITEEEAQGARIINGATEIWDEFKKHFWWYDSNQKSTQKEIIDTYKNVGAAATGSDPDAASAASNNFAWNIAHPVPDSPGRHKAPKYRVSSDEGLTVNMPTTLTKTVAASLDPNRGDDKPMITQLNEGFVKFLWQNPYGRAWLPYVMAAKSDHTSVGDVDIDFFDFGPEDLEFNLSTDAIINAWGQFLTITAEEQDKNGDWRKILEVAGLPSPVDGHLVTSEELTDDHPMRRFLQWLRENALPGNKKGDLVSEAISAIQDLWGATIGRIIDVAGNLLQGVISQFRIQLQLLGQGLSMVGHMQRQSHLLNKVLNDSIYYSAGDPGSLIRLADNPFTREYGEPVVEIREPFQRMHYVSSFTHILNNGIQETSVDVPTVITATSDNKYPVTVHFDKGMSSERQLEKAVDTGLMWDNYQGSGFFSFLHPLLAPMETARGLMKTATGSSDELLSRRVALWHLKEGLKDIYQGEIIVLGDPDIRPHDLLYIADVFERIYGICEVESVTHHFTPDSGFITSVVPNAVVTVQDPARWSMISWIRSVFDTKNLRDDTRNLLQMYADSDSHIRNTKFISNDELAESLQTQFMGHLQYTQGTSALIKDITAAKATGLLVSSQERLAYLDSVSAAGGEGELGSVTREGAAEAGARFGAGLNPFTDLLFNDWAWGAWEWVRDNLLDQHSCYISYLTKDGQPMDAGLSYSQGTAVGMHHSKDILPDILGLTTYTTVDGHKRITVNDMLSALGWSEVDVNAQYKYTSWWVSQENAKIMSAAGKTPDSLSIISASQASATLVRVVRIVDGDTMEVEGIDGGGTYKVRLSGIDTPERLDHGADPYNNQAHPGEIATLYAQQRLIDDLEEAYGEAVVAIRVADRSEDDYGRQLAVMFHTTPGATSAEDRREKLLEYARDFPAITWDSFHDNGLPYTFNWEMVMSGNSQVDMYRLSRWYEGVVPVTNE